MMNESSRTCELCVSNGGRLLWRNAFCRIVSVADPDYPGFCRVILNRHVAEMTDLADDEQQELMRVVFAVEAVVREVVKPDKINLASLGNMVPHVHWHVIPRWREDRCFPNPIWAPAQREATASQATNLTTAPAAIDPTRVLQLADELSNKLAVALAKRLGPPEMLSDGGQS